MAAPAAALPAVATRSAPPVRRSKQGRRLSIVPTVEPTTSTPVVEQGAPERTLQQRMDALDRANEIRIQRAELKRDLKAGRRSIHQLLQDPPDFVETMKVFDALLAVPKYGRVKVNKVIVHARISPSKTIGGLSERQRAELIGLLHR